MLIAGDSNIHVNVPDDPDIMAFEGILHTFALKQLVTVRTHVHGNKLDLLLVRESCDLLSVQHLRDISDHCFFKDTLATSKPGPKRRTIEMRHIKNMAHTQLEGDLNEIVQDLLGMHDATDLATEYNNRLRNLLDQHALLVKKKVTLRHKVDGLTVMH